MKIFEYPFKTLNIFFILIVVFIKYVHSQINDYFYKNNDNKCYMSNYLVTPLLLDKNMHDYLTYDIYKKYYIIHLEDLIAANINYNNNDNLNKFKFLSINFSLLDIDLLIYTTLKVYYLNYNNKLEFNSKHSLNNIIEHINLNEINPIFTKEGIDNKLVTIEIYKTINNTEIFNIKDDIFVHVELIKDKEYNYDSKFINYSNYYYYIIKASLNKITYNIDNNNKANLLLTNEDYINLNNVKYFKITIDNNINITNKLIICNINVNIFSDYDSFFNVFILNKEEIYKMYNIKKIYYNNNLVNCFYFQINKIVDKINYKDNIFIINLAIFDYYYLLNSHNKKNKLYSNRYLINQYNRDNNAFFNFDDGIFDINNNDNVFIISNKDNLKLNIKLKTSLENKILLICNMSNNYDSNKYIISAFLVNNIDFYNLLENKVEINSFKLIDLSPISDMAVNNTIEIQIKYTSDNKNKDISNEDFEIFKINIFNKDIINTNYNILLLNSKHFKQYNLGYISYIKNFNLDNNIKNKYKLYYEGINNNNISYILYSIANSSNNNILNSNSNFEFILTNINKYINAYLFICIFNTNNVYTLFNSNECYTLTEIKNNIRYNIKDTLENVIFNNNNLLSDEKYIIDSSFSIILSLSKDSQIKIEYYKPVIMNINKFNIIDDKNILKFAFNSEESYYFNYKPFKENTITNSIMVYSNIKKFIINVKFEALNNNNLIVEIDNTIKNKSYLSKLNFVNNLNLANNNNTNSTSTTYISNSNNFSITITPLVYSKDDFIYFYFINKSFINKGNTIELKSNVFLNNYSYMIFKNSLICNNNNNNKLDELNNNDCKNFYYYISLKFNLLDLFYIDFAFQDISLRSNRFIVMINFKAIIGILDIINFNKIYEKIIIKAFDNNLNLIHSINIDYSSNNSITLKNVKYLYLIYNDYNSIINSNIILRISVIYDVISSIISYIDHNYISSEKNNLSYIDIITNYGLINNSYNNNFIAIKENEVIINTNILNSLLKIYQLHLYQNKDLNYYHNYKLIFDFNSLKLITNNKSFISIYLYEHNNVISSIKNYKCYIETLSKCVIYLYKPLLNTK